MSFLFVFNYVAMVTGHPVWGEDLEGALPKEGFVYIKVTMKREIPSVKYV